MQNDKGQGVSHATDSKVPAKIQEQAPSKLEHELPDVSPPSTPSYAPSCISSLPSNTGSKAVTNEPILSPN